MMRRRRDNNTETKICIYLYKETDVANTDLVWVQSVATEQVCSRQTQLENSTLRNCSSEDSCNSSFQKPERHLSIFISIRVIFTVICIGGNFLLIRKFCKFSHLRTPASNVILVILCIADCFMAITFILDIIHLALKKGDNVKLMSILCQINASLTLSITIVIVLHLALISVERVIAVKFSLRYHSILTNRRALLASVALWVSTVFWI